MLVIPSLWRQIVLVCVRPILKERMERERKRERRQYSARNVGLLMLVVGPINPRQL